MNVEDKQLARTVFTAFAGKRVLITGHTGFKGAWLSLWLAELGADVYGMSLPAADPEGMYTQVKQAVFRGEVTLDIADQSAVQAAVESIQPDLVFHLAAQALVRQSYTDPWQTLQTNVMGSASVLDAVRKLPKTCHTIFVTSDKCYRNREWVYSYRENDALGGRDPYSMSKAAAEMVAESWRRCYFDKLPQGSRVISVRAGNVIGGGDYAADRLIPDCVRAALANEPLVIRNPTATRPWQHVLDCLYGYLLTAAIVPNLPASHELESFNFGPADPHAHPVASVAQLFFQHWTQTTPGVVIEAADGQADEAHYLSVSIEKAQRLLGWKPIWPFATAMQRTVQWYAGQHLERADMLAISRRQIAEFTETAQDR